MTKFKQKLARVSVENFLVSNLNIENA